MGEKRHYRNRIRAGKRPFFRVTVKETDLFVHTHPPLENLTRELILTHRAYLESYIDRYPEFQKTLIPWKIRGPMPGIVREMTAAGIAAGVGPMAAVAGAIAESVGKGLLGESREVIVENGGDIFIKTDEPLILAIYAGKSPLTYRFGIEVDSRNSPVSVCTSSGTVGHSLSLGNADAVCVISGSCSLADAAATSIGNRVQSADDIERTIGFGRSIPGVNGLVIIVGNRVGLWGDVKTVPIKKMG